MRGRMGAGLGSCRRWGRCMRVMRSWVSLERLREGRNGVLMSGSERGLGSGGSSGHHRMAGISLERSKEVPLGDAG